MKERIKLTILCRNRKCRNPVTVLVTLDISFYHTKDLEDIYNVRISNVTNENCKKCGRKVVTPGPLIGSVV